MKKIATLLVLMALVFSTKGQAYKRDSTLKNTVRVNLTPLLITGNWGSATFGYERVLWKRQTVSVNAGHLQLPPIVTTKQGSPVTWINSLRNTGFTGSIDYRFYFKRNKYAAPDGLYWGPFLTYYYIDNKAGLELNQNSVAQGSATVQTYINMTMVGAQLGYQFVLGKHWTIDLVMIGPGVGFYTLQMNLEAEGNLSGDPEYLQGVYDALVSLFPAAEQLFQEQRIDAKGRKSFNGAGFRTVLQVGFRF